MKKGDKVRIYEDPITCENLEGMATLVELERVLESYGVTRLLQWKVHFCKDEPGELFTRFIRPDRPDRP